ncbi:EMC6-like membrane protein [Natronobiforma cellulositropha]|uniref:EMC6-like membrane protein n=1 Tax=Natronobiforma cellulositropha TaxID=1679076 RepID=UPI0021D5B019|nr:hypothetical protein [Natronobiforma cellulositropha]
MATESISDRREHVRSIGVTAVAALLGVGAAIASMLIIGDPAAAADPAQAADEYATDIRALLIVIAVIAIQFPLLKASRIYHEDEFGIKHYLFITFMTFSFWFVTWGVLLTSRAIA